ncbi:MAG: hypothetical protein AAGH19_03560 [Pseudomonadota bacterium]
MPSPADTDTSTAEAPDGNVLPNPVRQRARFRRPLLFLGATLAVLLVAWLSVPVWAPSLAGRALPPGWTIDRLELDVPGVNTATIPVAVARAQFGGMQLLLRGENARVRYAGLAVAMERLTVDVVTRQM